MIHTQLIFICDECEESESFLLDNNKLESVAYDDAIEWAFNRGWKLDARDDLTVGTFCVEHA